MIDHLVDLSDPDDECADENEEYLEYLESKAEDHDDEDGDSDGSNWSLDLMMEEDVFFTTVLDKIDAYNTFESLMGHLATLPELYAHLTQSLGPEKRLAVESLVLKSRENKK